MRTEDAVARIRNNAGWLRLEQLGLIRVSGPNRIKFLHSLLSNDIASLAPGQSRRAALMNLKGQQVAWMQVLVEADAVFCELPVAVRDRVVDTFIHYKVGAPVRFEKTDSTIFGVVGRAARETLTALGATSIPENAGTFSISTVADASVRISCGQDLPAQGFTVHVLPSQAASLEEALRGRLGEPLTPAVLNTLRVEEGLPWHGIDVTEENLLHETGQLGVYHSSSKGCYLGQEVVARLEGRGGNVNKKLMGLKCDAPVAAGAEISCEEKVIGRVTSAGRSPQFGPIAMGYAHRAQSEPGTKVTVAGIAAEIVALPFRT